VNSIAQAVEFLERGDLANAARTASAVGEHDPDALHLLGLIRSEQSRRDEAVDFFNRSLARRPGHPHVLTNLGKTLKFLGRNAEAVAAFNAALASKPDLPDALCELGELQYRAGEYADAEALLRRVLAQMSSHVQAKLWLGLVLKACGRFEEGEAVLSAGLIQARETNLKAAFACHLAAAQYQQGKEKDALANFALAARLIMSLGEHERFALLRDWCKARG
jgi:tetratricopeptide (TPR) repeat protein